jgi:hypothetical protein
MLSKQFNFRSFSKLSSRWPAYGQRWASSKLNPWFVTGDAEGSFTVLIVKDIKRKLG